MIIRVHSLLVLLCVVAFTLADKSSKVPDGDLQPTPTPAATTPGAKTTPDPTKSPTITTTHAPTTTTTHAPNTTTPSPPTTTPTTTPTTPITTPTPPTTTTTHAPNTTTPTPPTTTPTPPITTHAPPVITDWVVKENNTVCIIANMHMKITVPYVTKDNKTIKAEFELMNTQNATASGTCQEHNQTLVLMWHKSNISSIFTFDHKNGSDMYSLSSVDFTFPVNGFNFENNTMNATAIHVSLGSNIFSLPLNNSYTCANVEPLSLNGTALNGTVPVANTTIYATLNLSGVHVEAFGKTNTTHYGAPKDCISHETPDILPIAVGLILAGLVVVVLLAYLIGRRRAQARGYLSM